MILYQNNLMVLDYDPASDILSVEWPNTEDYLLPEVNTTLKTLVEYVRNYDVKRLLIDASQTTYHPELMDSPEYKKIVFEFVAGLNQTRLQKSARIISGVAERERKSQELTQELQHKNTFSVKNKSFHTVAEAKAWLLSDFIDA